MLLSVNLQALERHQDYLQQELRTAEMLMCLLKQKYETDQVCAPEAAAMLQRQMYVVSGLQDRIRRRAKLLSETETALSHAKADMRQANTEAAYLLGTYPEKF